MNKLISVPTPAENDAIAGNAAPDLVYYPAKGIHLDWRSTVTADPSGFVDLGKALKTDSTAVAYVTRKIVRKQGGTAKLRVGVDFFMKVWVNGKLVLDLSSGGGCAPRPNTHSVLVELRPGVNIISMKVTPGSKGFGFYANISDEGADFGQKEQQSEKVDFYPGADRSWDPYHFRYY